MKVIDLGDLNGATLGPGQVIKGQALEALVEAGAIISKAHEQAAEIVKKAEHDAEIIRAQAKSSVENINADAKKQALTLAMRELGLRHQLSLKKILDLRAFHIDILNRALKVLLKSEFPAQAVAGAIERALILGQHEKKISLTLNPKDAELLADRLTEFEAQQIVIVRDPQQPQGTCILSTAGGSIDASVDLAIETFNDNVIKRIFVPEPETKQT